MKTIYADFNDVDADGTIPLICQGSVSSIAALEEPLREGEEVWLSDDYLRVIGRVFLSSDGSWSCSSNWRFLHTLYRPVGPAELKLIEGSGWKAFPPRLPDQPIFYPVVQKEYAIRIARDWNVKADGAGYVTQFNVDLFPSKSMCRGFGDPLLSAHATQGGSCTRTSMSRFGEQYRCSNEGR